MAADAAAVAPLRASARADPVGEDADVGEDFGIAAAADAEAADADRVGVDDEAFAEGSAGQACSSEEGDMARDDTAADDAAVFAAELADAAATLKGGA